MPNHIPEAGSVFWFRTSPFTEFAASVTNRYSALKVLGNNKDLVVIAVLDSIWTIPPTLNDIRHCNILKEHRFSHTGRSAIWGVNTEWWDLSDLDEMTFLGILPVSPEEVHHAEKVFDYLPGTSFTTLGTASIAAEGEWRWANDRQAFVEEYEKETAQKQAKRVAQEARYQERLRGLTWEQLLSETPFERWSPSPPFPPLEFVTEARRVIHETCHRLSELGTKPRKADVRKLLRECVNWFNEADEEAGGVIETEEREDICMVLEEMAFVARQKTLVDEIEQWRTW